MLWEQKYVPHSHNANTMQYNIFANNMFETCCNICVACWLHCLMSHVFVVFVAFLIDYLALPILAYIFLFLTTRTDMASCLDSRLDQHMSLTFHPLPSIPSLTISPPILRHPTARPLTACWMSARRICFHFGSVSIYGYI